jgi:hypothetical protein
VRIFKNCDLSGQNIKIITSRRMRWAGYAARMGSYEKRIQNFQWQNLTVRDHLKDSDGRKIRKWISKK